MDMLCIAAEADPTGYVLINRTTPTLTDLARLTGAPDAEIETLLAELERNGVFSRDGKGRIYSRRMVRDIKKSKINQKNGRNGGVASVEKQRGIFQSPKPPLEPPPKPRLGPYKPEAISQKDSPKSPINPAVVGVAGEVLFAFYEIRRQLWGIQAKAEYSPKEVSIARDWIERTNGDSEPLRALFEAKMRRMTDRNEPPPGSLWFFNRSVSEAAASNWAGYR